MIGGPHPASNKGGGDLSSCWDGDRGCPGGRMILCGDILGGWQWVERRVRSGFPPRADIVSKK